MTQQDLPRCPYTYTVANRPSPAFDALEREFDKSHYTPIVRNAARIMLDLADENVADAIEYCIEAYDTCKTNVRSLVRERGSIYMCASRLLEAIQPELVEQELLGKCHALAVTISQEMTRLTYGDKATEKDEDGREVWTEDAQDTYDHLLELHLDELLDLKKKIQAACK